MDKDILRIVIISLGILIMLGMVMWSFFKNRKPPRNKFYSKKEPLGKIDDSLVINTENDDFDVVPLGAVSDYELSPDIDPIFGNTKEYQETEFKDYDVETFDTDTGKETSLDIDNNYGSEIVENSSLKMKDDFSPEMEEQFKSEVQESIANELGIDNFEDVGFKQHEPEEKESNFEMPSVIQIHVFALDYEGFKGNDLRDAFQESKLEYGSVKIFERLDEKRRVDFAVASMVEPGTFPETEMESFNCPGIVFFLQPAVLDNPLQIFDEFISTIDTIAKKLDGVKLDQHREPLSKDTIKMIRKGLSAA